MQVMEIFFAGAAALALLSVVEDALSFLAGCVGAAGEF